MLVGVGLQDKREVVQGVYSVIDQLSRTHLNTLERLVFHLVRWDISTSWQPGWFYSMPVATAVIPWSTYCMFHDLCRFVSGSHSRRRRTACLQTRWPSCLHPAYCAVPTPLTRYRASGTSARPLRKMLYATFTSILFYIFVKQLNTVQVITEIVT